MPINKRCPVAECQRPHASGDVFCPIHGVQLMVEAAPLLEQGQVIAGKYVIARRIGAGGMGEVYLADQISPRQNVAIKVLHPQFMSDHARRFQEEAERAAQVRHPNAVTIYETGKTSEGLLYIAMEYIPGIDLNVLIARDGPRSNHFEAEAWHGRTVRIVEQLCDVLDEAHGLKPPLIHRDIKPSNIRIWSSATTGDFVKLVDFGIAKQVGVTGFTRQGQIPGTPGYISPEQLEEHPIDARSDLYSLGVVWFQMLTGELPFQGSGDYDTAMMRLRVRAPEVTSLNPRVPAELAEILARLLERNPKDRFASAAQLRTAVEAMPRVVKPLTPPSMTVRAASREPVAVTVLPSTSGGVKVEPTAARRALQPWQLALSAVVVFLAGMALTRFLLTPRTPNQTDELSQGDSASITQSAGQTNSSEISTPAPTLVGTLADSGEGYWRNYYAARFAEDSMRLSQGRKSDSGKWVEQARAMIRDSLRQLAQTPAVASTPSVVGGGSSTPAHAVPIGTLASGDTILISLRRSSDRNDVNTCDDDLHRPDAATYVTLACQSSEAWAILYLIPNAAKSDSLDVYTWRIMQEGMVKTALTLAPLTSEMPHAIKAWYDKGTGRVFFSIDHGPKIVINSYHRGKPVHVQGCASGASVSFQVARV